MTVFDAPSINNLPTLTDPVNCIFRTRGSASIACPIDSGSPLMTLNTPGGNPASWKMSAMSIADLGVCSDGRTTTGFPAAMAAAAARMML